MVKEPSVTKEQQPEVVDLSELKEDKAFDPETAMIDPGDRTLSAVGYFGFFCILPLVLRPKSDFCRFHGKQALAVAISIIPLTIFARFLDLALGMPLGIGMISFLFFLLQCFLAWKAWGGEQEKMPPFSTIVDKYLQWDEKIKDEVELTEEK